MIEPTVLVGRAIGIVAQSIERPLARLVARDPAVLGSNAESGDAESRGARAAHVALFDGVRRTVPIQVLSRHAGIRVAGVPEQLQRAPGKIVQEGVLFRRETGGGVGGPGGFLTILPGRRTGNPCNGQKSRWPLDHQPGVKKKTLFALNVASLTAPQTRTRL